MKNIVRILIFVLFVLCFVALISGVKFLIEKEWVSGFLIIGASSLFLIIFGLGGLFTIHQEERAVIELFGRFYKIKKPGLRWRIPFIMSIRQIVPIWEQTLVLFKSPIKIDFEDGSATPKGVEAFVKIKNPDINYLLPKESKSRPSNGIYRTVYYVDNWEERCIRLLENAVRSYLATLTIDEALPKRRGGYDLLTSNRIPKTEKDKIKQGLENWGLELIRITVTDFDLEKDIVEARGEVQKRKRFVEVAKFEKSIRAKETIGALVEMFSEISGESLEKVREQIKGNPIMQKNLEGFIKELITRQMSIDGKALTDIRVQGEGGASELLMPLIAAFKKIPSNDVSPKEDLKKGKVKKEG